MLRLGPATLELEYRYRDEDIGTLTQSVHYPELPPGVCEGFGPCEQNFVIPFGYTSHTVGLSVRAALLGSRLHLGASGGVEWRTYLADSYLETASPNGASDQIDHRLRVDTRFFGDAFAEYRVWRGLSFSLRYDLTVNQSNVDDTISPRLDGGCGFGGAPGFVCHLYDYDNKNYVKHVVLFETVYQW